MSSKVILVLFLVSFCFVNCYNEIGRRHEAIDSSFLESALDAEECHRQIRVIRRNTLLLLQFTDAGLRTPRGLLMGNSVDLGNYHQCLGIDHQLEEMHIEGKYCSIRVPFRQNFELPRPQDMQGTQFDPSSLRLDNETISKIEEFNFMRAEIQALSGDLDGFRSGPGNPLANSVFRLGVCVPKPCTTEQAITSFFFNVTAVGFRYTEDFCRLPGDKTWSPADYTAVAVFSVLGFITLVSTAYDLSYRFLFKKDVKEMSVLGRSFSVYTNGQRLTAFSSGPGNLQCVDGIRTLAMVWVIVGHSFTTETFIPNMFDVGTWMYSNKALWITAATMTVDTFFTLGGVLLVYTTVGKMNQISFLKNLHWFYLNRFMRVTPMLAVTVLLQASYYNRMADGPHWGTVAYHTDKCRDTWWVTLLHVQNLVHPTEMCINHSWYVAIDFQLYVVSPLVLFWVFTGKKHLAWSGLISGLAAVLVASTVYCFQINMQAGNLVPTRFQDIMDYLAKYYFFTLTRASPFFVGLIAGYILHLYRKKKMNIPWILAILFWAISAGILGGIFYFKYRIKQFDWDNQTVDNLLNSFMRPVYACALSWLIIACVHGYAGPINWFLSLDVWRLPARLTYGMFLFHYPLMFTLNATMIAPVYFSVGGFTFKFLSYLVLSVVYSFIFTLLVDSPVTVLFKMLMDAGKKKKPADKTIEEVKEDNVEKSDISMVNDKNINYTKIGLSEENINCDDVNTSPNGLIVNSRFNDVQFDEQNDTESKDVNVNSISNDVKFDSNDIANPNAMNNDSSGDDNVVRIDDSGIQVYSESISENEKSN